MPRLPSTEGRLWPLALPFWAPKAGCFSGPNSLTKRVEAAQLKSDKPNQEAIQQWRRHSPELALLIGFLLGTAPAKGQPGGCCGCAGKEARPQVFATTAVEDSDGQPQGFRWSFVQTFT